MYTGIWNTRCLGLAIIMVAWLAGLVGCTGSKTFPNIARAGDTISVMVGGSEQARKDSIGAILTDSAGGQWDLQALGLVRSVFNLRPDGRAKGLHYSPHTELYVSWLKGHEPVQTVLVTDLPASMATGIATLDVSLNVTDNSSGIADPARIRLEILDGIGTADLFNRKGTGGPFPADFASLEPAPHAKVSFSSGTIIGAAALSIDVDETVVNFDDINIHVPQSTVRGTFSSTGAHGEKQRMVYWHHDGDKVHIIIIAPQGIDGRYLQVYLVHPSGLAASPNIMISSATLYDINGNLIDSQPALTYFQN